MCRNPGGSRPPSWMVCQGPSGLPGQGLAQLKTGREKRLLSNHGCRGGAGQDYQGLFRL